MISSLLTFVKQILYFKEPTHIKTLLHYILFSTDPGLPIWPLFIFINLELITENVKVFFFNGRCVHIQVVSIQPVMCALGDDRDPERRGFHFQFQKKTKDESLILIGGGCRSLLTSGLETSFY